jgi:hypothetical protein
VLSKPLIVLLICNEEVFLFAIGQFRQTAGEPDQYALNATGLAANQTRVEGDAQGVSRLFVTPSRLT